MSNKTRILALISGKGGSGKTVIGLSIANALSSINKKVLLIDCDTSTHGATYFFENLMDFSESITSLQEIAKSETVKIKPLKINNDFDFIPSSIDTSNNIYENPELIETTIIKLKTIYDVIILDCQAGYSEVMKSVISVSDKNLIVMEADSISASSIRVLFLQLGNKLSTKNTLQIFNKLSDDERLIYDKIIGGTIFPNLPAIPFDWTVRASFSLGNIPDILSKESAFGIGVIRLCKSLFQQFSQDLNDLENNVVGDWFNEIRNNLKKMEEEKIFLKSK